MKSIGVYINLRMARDVFLRGGLRPDVRHLWRPSDSFSSLLAAFTLTVHINALYNERVHGKEEHATSINTFPLKISHLFGCFLCRIDEVNASPRRKMNCNQLQFNWNLNTII